MKANFPTTVSIIFLLEFSVSNSFAAEIELIDTGTSVDLIYIQGEIESVDSDKFRRVVSKTTHGNILLESPGGDLLAGLQIGEQIRSRGFSTGVAPEMACASACALAWLAGSTRYMAPSALIGFHAAYIETNGEAQESGVANALVGAYLTELGLGMDAIIFATSAGPDEMNWLNAAQALSAGIDLTILTSDGKITAVEKPQALRLPSGYRWIVLESAISPSSLLTAGISDQIVKTQNGYYASVVGPFERATAEHYLLTDPMIPSDAYLSSGNGFLFGVQ